MVPRIIPKQPARLDGELWGITTYFNPAKYANKVEHLRRFSDSARRQGLKLLIVELAFGDEPHVLEEALADRIIRLRTHTVLWHRERLVNLALGELPADCDKVVWLDADILFESDRWIDETSRLLQDYMVVQPFHTAWMLPPGCVTRPATAEQQRAVTAYRGAAHAYHAGYGAREGHIGLAWAFRREVLQKHGFYDRSVLGGGDLVQLLAVFGYFGQPGTREMFAPWCSDRHLLDAEAWGRRLAADVNVSVFYAGGLVLHLWHGSVENRKYDERGLILKAADYDPAADIALDDNGCWRWNSDKPELHRRVKEYFWNRQEQLVSAS